LRGGQTWLCRPKLQDINEKLEISFQTLSKSIEKASVPKHMLKNVIRNTQQLTTSINTVTLECTDISI